MKTTTTTTTGHTLTVDTAVMEIVISGPGETMQSIPDAELDAAARDAGLEVDWARDALDEVTYGLRRPRPSPEEARRRARLVAANAQRIDPSLGDAAYAEALGMIEQTGHATARRVVAALRRRARLVAVAEPGGSADRADGRANRAREVTGVLRALAEWDSGHCASPRRG